MLETAWGRASGVGSWPGTDVLECCRTVFGELTDPRVPHLPELPSRGPGSDLIGRGAVFLVETPVDLQPSGWRLVARPGRDLERAQSMLRQDLDVLAEVADGFDGTLKVQVAGPWTLAASLYLPRLERAVVDAGACRDIVAALAEGTSRHIGEIRRLVPDAQIVLQVDEPGIGGVLSGSLPTASGFGRLRSVEEPVVTAGLRTVLDAGRAAGCAHVSVHSCAADTPLPTLLAAGADGVSVDVGLLGVAGWEALAEAIESGLWLWAGAVPTSGTVPTPGQVADAVWTPWRRLGLDAQRLDQVVVTPSCGLSGATPATARGLLGRAVAGATELAGRAQG